MIMQLKRSKNKETSSNMTGSLDAFICIGIKDMDRLKSIRYTFYKSILAND